ASEPAGERWRCPTPRYTLLMPPEDTNPGAPAQTILPPAWTQVRQATEWSEPGRQGSCLLMPPEDTNPGAPAQTILSPVEPASRPAALVGARPDHPAGPDSPAADDPTHGGQ